MLLKDIWLDVKAVQERDQTAEEPHIVGPEPVSDPVPDQGMDSLV